MARKAAVFVAAVAALGLLAQPAGAAESTVNCAGLQSALSGAKAGDRITLNELCKGGFPYKLPAVAVTLAGTPGAGFDGGSTAQLEGSTASSTIEGLIFENANNPAPSAGGALSINGAGSPAAVTLARDSFVNNAGAEGGGARVNTATAAVTVTESTFTGNSAKGAGGGLLVFATTASLTGDTFSANSAGPNGLGGGLVVDSDTTTLSSSQFTNNTATDSGGGAEITTLAAGGVGVTLLSNTFSHNSVADPGGTSTHATGYLGGGLALEAVGAEPTGLVQAGNAFDSNSVSFKAVPVSAMGAGEAVSRVALQSTGDRFTNNTLQGPNATKNAKAEPVFGWGAGLSVVQCADTIVEPPAAPTILSTLSNAVVAGNTLISGPNANGAGIYVGFACANAYTALQLNDSTVAGNAISGASGPVAGISGGPRDVLSLANTIVAGDSGGAEIGGFQGLAGVSASFSDVCSGGAPFAGSGNICADPLLLSPGPGSADVRETAASPTLERGSNGLIPAGLSTDAFGGPRVRGPILCGASPAAIVDIGAAEFAYPAPSCPPIVLLSHPQGPTGAPKLSNLTASALRWREGNRLAQISASKGKRRRRPPIGTTFSFTLDRTAHVTFKFTHAVPGRRVGRRCDVPTRKNRHKRACRRTVVAGALAFSAHAGRNRVRFRGLIARGKRLPPGSYTVLVTASASGKRSRTAMLSFTIVR
jgi:hypothetical protein